MAIGCRGAAPTYLHPMMICNMRKTAKGFKKKDELQAPMHVQQPQRQPAGYQSMAYGCGETAAMYVHTP